MLFNLYLDAVLKVALKKSRQRHLCVQNLPYAYDILIINSNIEAMNDVFAEVASKINFKKKILMCTLPDNTNNNSINPNKNIRNNIDKNINKKNINKSR